MSTLIAKETAEQRVRAEGIAEKPLAISYRWAESNPSRQGKYDPPKPGVRSALVCCDLLLRSDGSFVLLDGAMAADSVAIAADFRRNGTRGLSWDDFVAETKRLPMECYPS